MREWVVVRLTGGSWLTTDHCIGGDTPETALDHAKDIARRIGWEDVRLGRELGTPERYRYSDMAWLTLN